MKYEVILSGQDINLIEVAIRLRLESAEDGEDHYWAKKWQELHNRIMKAKAKKVKND